MSEIRIDTAAITEAADTIKSINNQLTDTLASSRATVQSLESAWSGQAAEATISAYRAFEAKYSQHYQDLLDQYSRFLRSSAAEGYQETESQGAQKAQSIDDWRGSL